eukprot:82459-Pyramimonas_sp.AAC.1
MMSQMGLPRGPTHAFSHWSLEKIMKKIRLPWAARTRPELQRGRTGQGNRQVRCIPREAGSTLET